MTPKRIELLVKDVIRRATGAAVVQIRYDHSLTEDYEFTDMGKQNLSASLNGQFKDFGEAINPPLHPNDTQACKLVGDLGHLIRKRFGV